MTSSQEIQWKLTKRKLEELEKSRLCKICEDYLADTLYINCGHIAICTFCSDTCCLIMCPICKKKIKKKMKIYFA